LKKVVRRIEVTEQIVQAPGNMLIPLSHPFLDVLPRLKRHIPQGVLFVGPYNGIIAQFPCPGIVTDIKGAIPVTATVHNVSRIAVIAFPGYEPHIGLGEI